MLINKKVWRVEDVARHLQLEKGTIYNKISAGTIPFYKPEGRRFPYFIPEEIENWIQGGRF